LGFLKKTRFLNPGLHSL